MNPDERFDDRREAQQNQIDRSLDRLWTSLPAFISKGGYAGDKQTVKLTSAIKGEEAQFDGSGNRTYKPVSMPQLPDVPIHYPSWGGWTVTGPLKDGDEGIVMFASRPIDFWWQNGGEQARGARRRHDLSDGMFIPGLRSQPKKLNPPPDTDGWAVRNDDGTVKMKLTDSALTVTIGAHTLTFQNGTLQVDGNVIAGFNGTDQVKLQDHLHDATQPAAPGTTSGKPKAGT